VDANYGGGVSGRPLRCLYCQRKKKKKSCVVSPMANRQTGGKGEKVGIKSLGGVGGGGV